MRINNAFITQIVTIDQEGLIAKEQNWQTSVAAPVTKPGHRLRREQCGKIAVAFGTDAVGIPASVAQVSREREGVGQLCSRT